MDQNRCFILSDNLKGFLYCRWEYDGSSKTALHFSEVKEKAESTACILYSSKYCYFRYIFSVFYMQCHFHLWICGLRHYITIDCLFKKSRKSNIFIDITMSNEENQHSKQKPATFYLLNSYSDAVFYSLEETVAFSHNVSTCTIMHLLQWLFFTNVATDYLIIFQLPHNLTMSPSLTPSDPLLATLPLEVGCIDIVQIFFYYCVSGSSDFYQVTCYVSIQVLTKCYVTDNSPR